MAALVDMGFAVSVVAAALRRLAEEQGPQQAAELWQATGLDLLSFLPSVSHCACTLHHAMFGHSSLPLLKQKSASRQCISSQMVHLAPMCCQGVWVHLLSWRVTALLTNCCALAAV